MKTTMIQILDKTTFAILTDDIEIIESDVNYMIDDSIIENSFYQYEDQGTASFYGYKRAFVYKVMSNLKQYKMKKQYIVRTRNGYYKAINKKDAIEFLKDNEIAEDIIYTSAQDGNYYHDRVKIIAEK